MALTKILALRLDDKLLSRVKQEVKSERDKGVTCGSSDVVRRALFHRYFSPRKRNGR